MSEMRVKETNISDDGAHRGEVVDINTLAVRHTTIGKSPEEVLQTAFRDNNGATTIGKKYKALKLGGVSRDGYEYILGYNRTTGKLRHKTLASTSLDFYGIHTNGVSTSYYIIRNDTYGNFSTDNVQLTGFVREHFKRKIIYLGTELDISLVGDNSDEFNPEWWKTHIEDDQPFVNTPLVPENNHGDNHTSFLIMDSEGQKFYMSENQFTLQEAKGYRLNVYEETDLIYEDAYTWTGHVATAIEDGVTAPTESGKIVFDMPDSLLSIDIDGTPEDGVITITAGTTSITITKDGNVNINSTTSIVFNNGTNTIIADGDIVAYGSNVLGVLSTSAGLINGMFSPFCGLPIPPAVGVGVDLTMAELSGGNITTSSSRLEKVED